MSGTSKNGSAGRGGVLGNLPSTRPQRPSARRASNRQRASADAAETAAADGKPRAAANSRAGAKPRTAAKPRAAAKPSAAAKPRAAAKSSTEARSKASAKPRTGASSKPRKSAKSATSAAAAAKPARNTGRRSTGRVPVQGFESEPRRSIDPPTGAEVVGAAVDAASGLARSGLDIGQRAVRGALSRLSRR